MSPRLQPVAAVLAAAFAFAAPARAADTLKVGQSIASCVCFAPVRIGLQTGIWAKQGLDVQSLVLRGDAQEMQALAAGSIDIGVGSGPGIGLLAKGVPAKAVAATANSLADMSLIVTPDSKVATLADLKGIRIGVSSAGSLTYWLVQKITQSQGMPQGAITPVSLGDFDSNLAGMKSGAVQGIVFGVEVAYLLEDRHEGRLLATMDKVVPNFISHVMFATDGLIKSNPDALRRFIAGWYQTVTWMRAHKPETVKMLADITKFPEDVMARTYDSSMPAMADNGQFDPAALATLSQSFVELGILTQKPDTAKLIDTHFLPEH